jgi:hypothetical protein
MANTKISQLSLVGKALFASTDYIPIARTANNTNARVAITELLPTLTNAGSGSHLLNLTSPNAFTQKALVSSNGLLTIASNSTDLTFTVNAGSINLASCNNATSAFLSTVDLSTNKATGTLPTTKGGTGLTTIPVKSVLISSPSTADTIQTQSMATNGTLLIGGTSGPNVTTLTAGNNITITNGNGTISIASSTPASAVLKDGSGNIVNSTGGITSANNLVFSDITKTIKYNSKNEVIQQTNASTGVTINAAVGLIKLFPTAITATTQISFKVTNSAVAETSFVFLTLLGPGIVTEADNTYLNVHVTSIAAGEFTVVLTNAGGHNLDTGPRSIQFLVIN